MLLWDCLDHSGETQAGDGPYFRQPMVDQEDPEESAASASDPTSSSVSRRLRVLATINCADSTPFGVRLAAQSIASVFCLSRVTKAQLASAVR